MKHAATRKMAPTAIMAGLAFVLNTFVYFPAMTPFQHFVDVVAAVFLGPWLVKSLEPASLARWFPIL